MILTRKLLLLLIVPIMLIGAGSAVAEDDPATGTTATDTAPLTLDQNQIDALTEAAGGDGGGEDRSVFEKASDFVTDNAPWFIIGIIVLAAIIAGILIMRGRPAKSPKAAKSNKAMRDAGGVPKDQPAQVPSASELRRRKRAAIQRSREEERMRRKAGTVNRKAARRGQVPPAAPMPPATAEAVGAAPGVAPGAIDPIEAEKQAARDQAVAAGAMARFGDVPAPGPTYAPVEPQAVPAPVSPSQTAPAAGVITPDTAGPPAYEEAEFAPAPEAETGVIRQPSIENPGPDAVVGNAAQAFLAGSAAGAAGGLAAAREARSTDPEPEEEPLEPVVAPEPGMAPEHALTDDPELEPGPTTNEPVADERDPAVAEADQRLRAKVDEIKATQGAEPGVAEGLGAAGSGTDLSPGLAAVERRLSENSVERDRALREAEERLQRIEQRAEDAERRAAFAERLAQLKVEESEREKRLNQVVSGLDRAEQRAREAEARAEAAERAAAAALEQTDLKSSILEGQAGSSAPSEPVEVASSPESGSAGSAAADPDAPEKKGLFRDREPSSPASDPNSINLNRATFEELREAGLSVTQATRILAYRERFGGYSSVEDLERVPGFPADLIESLQGKLSI